jgi:predicted transcriptional regulator
MGKKLISVRVDEGLWKATKHLAVDRDTTVESIVQGALERFVRTEGRPVFGPEAGFPFSSAEDKEAGPFTKREAGPFTKRKK